jgi:DNA-binding IclR family transcriptional regulator
MTALAPSLTHIDRRILAIVDRPHGVRVRDIAPRLRMEPGEVRRILRGLEHLGLAQQAGWWRAA